MNDSILKIVDLETKLKEEKVKNEKLEKDIVNCYKIILEYNKILRGQRKKIEKLLDNLNEKIIKYKNDLKKIIDEYDKISDIFKNLKNKNYLNDDLKKIFEKMNSDEINVKIDEFEQKNNNIKELENTLKLKDMAIEETEKAIDNLIKDNEELKKIKEIKK